MKRTQAILRSMVDRMKVQNWNKSVIVSVGPYGSRYCLLGHVTRARIDLDGKEPYFTVAQTVEREDGDRQVMAILRAVVFEQYPDFCQGYGWKTPDDVHLATFNDSAKTKFSDIQRVTEKALMRAIERDV